MIAIQETLSAGCRPVEQPDGERDQHLVGQPKIKQNRGFSSLVTGIPVEPELDAAILMPPTRLFLKRRRIAMSCLTTGWSRLAHTTFAAQRPDITRHMIPRRCDACWSKSSGNPRGVGESPNAVWTSRGSGAEELELRRMGIRKGYGLAG